MGTYVIFSKFSPEALRELGDLGKLAETVSKKLKAECPNVRWKASY